MGWRLTLPSRGVLVVLLAFAAAALAIGLAGPWPARGGERASGPLRHEAFLWQRSWSPEVEDAVARAGGELSALAVLVAEVTWDGEGGSMRVARVRPSWDRLRSSGGPVELALRIALPPGGFPAEGEPLASVVELARSIARRAVLAGLSPRGLQLDLDCPESKLSGYRGWVEAIRRAIDPLPVTLTALPSWLDRPEFAPLARAAGGFVLQVHSLRRRLSAGRVPSLCDAERSRAWIERAARAGVPFRVALPSYGYLVAIDAEGRVRGVRAEGRAPEWPAGWRVEEARANPRELAALVASLERDRPALLGAVVWFRLPVEGDERCWRWRTLREVMAGRAPEARLEVRTAWSAPGLLDVALANEGAAASEGALRVSVRWRREVPLLAADAVGGFAIERREPGEVALAAPGGPLGVRIAPGERRPVGWLRFGGGPRGREEEEVEIDARIEVREGEGGEGGDRGEADGGGGEGGDGGGAVGGGLSPARGAGAAVR